MTGTTSTLRYLGRGLKGVALVGVSAVVAVGRLIRAVVVNEPEARPLPPYEKPPREGAIAAAAAEQARPVEHPDPAPPETVPEPDVLVYSTTTAVPSRPSRPPRSTRPPAPGASS